MTLFLISLSLVIISYMGLILTKNLSNKKILDTWLGSICLFILIMSTVIGLGFGVAFNVVKTEYKEMNDCIVNKSPNSIIIDLSDSPQKRNCFESFKKFNSHKAVTEFSDSTKIFLEIQKSLYNIRVYNNIVWTNPPYKNFNKE